jgi:hypothetical protein
VPAQQEEKHQTNTAQSVVLVHRSFDILTSCAANRGALIGRSEADEDAVSQSMREPGEQLQMRHPGHRSLLKEYLPIIFRNPSRKPGRRSGAGMACMNRVSCGRQGTFAARQTLGKQLLGDLWASSATLLSTRTASISSMVSASIARPGTSHTCPPTGRTVVQDPRALLLKRDREALRIPAKCHRAWLRRRGG